MTVIGAGVTGCFIAKELSKYDLKVLVVDKEPTVAMGPTKGCSGVIHAFQLPFGSLKGRLCLEGNRLMDEEAKELGFRFERVGLILVCKSIFSSLIARIVKPYFSRHLDVEYLDEKKIRELEPNVDAKGGLFFPSAGVVNPVEMTFKAKRFAELNGVEFRFERKVVGINPDQDFELILDAGKNRERVHSRFVINCAGLYADEIAAMVGCGLKIVPSKGSHVVFEDRGFSSHLMAIFPLIPERRTKGGGSLVTIDGNLIWGPNLVDAKSKEDRSVKKEEVEGIIRKHSRIFKRRPEKVASVYAGVRAIAGRDFVINSPIENFINVAGIQSPGLTAAPAIARMVLGMLTDAFEKSGLKLKRKREIKLGSSWKETRSKRGEVICHCRMVFEDGIRRTIAEGGRTLDDIKHLTGAGMECGRCLPAIVEIMEKNGLPLRKDTCKSFIAWKVGGD